jgi:holin-like protein
MEKQPEPAAMSAAQFSPRGNKAAAPIAYTANSRVRRLFWIDLPVGFVVLVLCMLGGEQAKMWLHVPIPGNVLGLFILFLCFRLRLIPPELIEEAANRLLYILPALFIPIYVSAIGRGQLWSNISWFLLPALLAATAVLWMFVGHLAQYLLRRSFQNERVA